jgi:hypothetical protein
MKNSSVLMRDGGMTNIEYAAVAASSSGNNTLVLGVSGKNIRILSCMVIVAAAVTIRFESGPDGTAISGQIQLPANGGFTLPFSQAGWGESLNGALLNLELSSAVAVAGFLVYAEV